MMETTDEDEDLLLVKASAGLLADLERDLPKLLWKPSDNGPSTSTNRGHVHTQVRHKDLSYIINLVHLHVSE